MPAAAVIAVIVIAIIVITIAVIITVARGSVEIGTAVVGPVTVSVPSVGGRVVAVVWPVEWAVIRTVSAERKRRVRMMIAMVPKVRRAVAITSVIGPIVVQSRALLRSGRVIRRRGLVTPVTAPVWTMMMTVMMVAGKVPVGPETVETCVGLGGESGLVETDAVIRGVSIIS